MASRIGHHVRRQGVVAAAEPLCNASVKVWLQNPARKHIYMLQRMQHVKASGVQALFSDLGDDVNVRVFVDSAADITIAKNVLGKVRHIDE